MSIAQLVSTLAAAGIAALVALAYNKPDEYAKIVRMLSIGLAWFYGGCIAWIAGYSTGAHDAFQHVQIDPASTGFNFNSPLFQWWAFAPFVALVAGIALLQFMKYIKS